MSDFDAEVFARELLGEARELVQDIGSEGAVLAKELVDLQRDVEATIAALESERDGRRAQNLRKDLETFLPARKAAILSAAESAASASVQAKLKEALGIATKAALVVAKAFLTA